MEAANKECSVLAAGLPAKQAVLLQLSALLPRILRLQLLGGHSLFWKQMWKLGSAVSKQMSREAQRAVLVAV